MRYKSWYNRRMMDELGFQPGEMRMDAKYGGENFEEADQELFDELLQETSPSP